MSTDRRRAIAWLLVLLLFPARLHAQGVALESQTRGAMTARLEVQVADRGPGEAKASVWLRVTVAGPAGLEVQPAWLEDPRSVWKPWRLSAWAVEGGRVVWGQSIRLDQLKPGVEPLPDVKVRFRDSPAGTWEEVEWKDILKTVREIPDIETLPSPPPTPWAPYLQWLAVAVAVLLAAAWALRRRLAAKSVPLPPDQWALRELDRIERTVLPPAGAPDVFHTQVSNVVRRYLQERFGLRAPQQTTAEFLAAGVAQLAAQRALLREFFERCDLAKFARAGASPEDCRHVAGLARTFVRQSASPEPSTQPRPREIAP
jgi:hypothetical protein